MSETDISYKKPKKNMLSYGQAAETATKAGLALDIVIVFRLVGLLLDFVPKQSVTRAGPQGQVSLRWDGCGR